MPTSLRFTRQDAIVILTLNDPATRNALSGEAMFSAFEEAAAAVTADLTVRAVVLTGEGTTFCSGGNVVEMRERTGMFAGTPQQIANQYRAGIQRIPRALFQIDVPLIGAINGPAIGAGCDLACLCDIRIASERASFAESYLKLGIIPGFGGTWLLPRVIGYSRAAEMAFTGEAIDAKAALDAGLVSRIVPADDLMDTAMSLAGSIAKNPPQVLRWTKRLLREAQNARFEAILELAATYQGLAHHTADHAEALAAMRERRMPNFGGT